MRLTPPPPPSIVAKQCNLRKRNILGISRGSISGPSFKKRRLQTTVRERVKCNTRIYLVNLAGIYETFDTEL